MTGAKARLAACAGEFRARERKLGTARTRSLRATIALRVVANGDVTRVVAGADSDWPKEADERLRACVDHAFAGVAFPATESFELDLHYPLCIRADEPAPMSNDEAATEMSL